MSGYRFLLPLLPSGADYVAQGKRATSCKRSSVIPFRTLKGLHQKARIGAGLCNKVALSLVQEDVKEVSAQLRSWNRAPLEQDDIQRLVFGQSAGVERAVHRLGMQLDIAGLFENMSDQCAAVQLLWLRNRFRNQFG